MAKLTTRVMLEILEHEAIVPEAYKDSVGVWTWGVGVTDASGHKVGRYKDNPQTIKRCLEVYAWLLKTKYLPPVIEALGELPGHQLAAALSFHYNTGAIKKASWVKRFKDGNTMGARDAFMNWSIPREIIGRRKAERDLFFDKRWTSDGKVLIYGVAKPSYHPNNPRLVDIRGPLDEVVAAA